MLSGLAQVHEARQQDAPASLARMVQLTLVTPSWLPLAMAGGLLVLLGLLYWSMRRNLNRIDFDEEPESPASPGSPADGAPTH